MPRPPTELARSDSSPVIRRKKASPCLSVVFLYNKQYQALPEPVKILNYQLSLKSLATAITVPVIAELKILTLA